MERIANANRAGLMGPQHAKAAVLGRAPIGEVIFWPTDTAPAGFLKCNGAEVSETAYAELYAAIGDVYSDGGEAAGEFRLPDLRGHVPRFHDDGAGVDPDAASRTARPDGTNGDKVGTTQADDTKSHNHTASAASGGGHTHTYAGNQSTNTTTGGGSTRITSLSSGGGNSGTTTNNGTHSHTITVNATGGNETRPVNVALMACIRYE